MKRDKMKYLSTLVVFSLHCSAEADGGKRMHTETQRRRLSGGGSGQFDCEFCGPPFGPASGSVQAYFPPDPYKENRIISIGSMANDYNCNSLEGDQATACLALQQEYGYANLAWFQSQDPEKDHTLASVISSIGYPSAVQFSVGSVSNDGVKVQVNFEKANSLEKWITVNNAASVTGIAFLSLVEFADKNGNYIFDEGEEIARIDLGSQQWNAPQSASNSYSEGNEQAHAYSIAYSTQDNSLNFKFSTSDYEVVVNDQTLNGDRVKIDVGINYYQTQAGSLLALETAFATEKENSGAGPESTIASSINGSDGFIDWSNLANNSNNNGQYFRVVAGESAQRNLNSLSASAFTGLIQQFGAGIVVSSGYITFVDDADFSQGAAKCSGADVQADPAGAHNERACHMNCAATEGCKVYSFASNGSATGEPECVFGFSGGVQCFSANGYSP